MQKIFISYVHEDEAVAIQIARGLHSAGYETWIYSENSTAGDYLANIVQALDESQVMVVLISKSSLAHPNQVNIEIVRAHEKRKTFQPVLLDVTWDELDEQQKTWRLVLGSSIGITWKPDKPDEVIEKIVEVLPQPSPSSGTVVLKAEEVKEQEPEHSTTLPPQPEMPLQPIFTETGQLNLSRFDPTLTSAFRLVPQEVQLLGHTVIGTPHIFSVLLGIPGSAAQAALTRLAIDPTAIRTVIRESVRRQDQQVAPLVPELRKEFFSPNGLACMEKAEQSSAQKDRDLITEEDVLLVILRHTDGVTAKILDQVDHLREKLLAEITQEESESQFQPETRVDHPLRLAEDSRLILATAMKDAFTSGYDTIETPHFVTAITRMPDCKIARSLQKQNLDLDELRTHMRELMPPVGALSNLPPQLDWELYSSRLQEVLMIAELEALTSGEGAIHEVHLVTGMAQAESSLTMEFLRLLGVDFDQLKIDVQTMDALPPSESQSQPVAIPAPQGTATTGVLSIQVSDILRDSQIIAFQYGYKRVETPFLLIAVLAQPDSCLGRGLKAQGFDPAVVQNALRTSMAPAGSPKDIAPLDITDINSDILSPRVQNILKISEVVAGDKVEENHLMVGILKSQGGQTTAYLQSLGIDLQKLLDFAEKEVEREGT